MCLCCVCSKGTRPSTGRPDRATIKCLHVFVLCVQQGDTAIYWAARQGHHQVSTCVCVVCAARGHGHLLGGQTGPPSSVYMCLCCVCSKGTRPSTGRPDRAT